MTAVLDANVLYPAPVRDLLLSLADAGQFQPKWSVRIQDEWTRNLLANRPDLKKEALDKTITAMNEAFPDALIKGYEKAEDIFNFPDPDDRHVAAAALVGKAGYIVTSNQKDFPADQLAPIDVLVL